MSTKRIAILTEFNYEDMELWYPFYRLKEEGHETFTIGPEKGKTYNSKHGYPCKAEYGIDEIKVNLRKDKDNLKSSTIYCFSHDVGNVTSYLYSGSGPKSFYFRFVTWGVY